jgi:hypothetical protein
MESSPLVGIDGEGGAQGVAVGRSAVSRRMLQAVEDRQISPGWLKIGLGTSKTIPYFTSVCVIAFFRINQSHHIARGRLFGVEPQ